MDGLLQIHFMRHGETEWTLSGQHAGRTDLPLTPRGEATARRLGQALQGVAFTTVLSSPRLRARRTCELAGLGAMAQTETNLTEWDYGDYEGLRTKDIRALRADWDVWTNGCPGGEMPADVTGRADRLIARLLKLGGHVALFSHGPFGRVLLARWIGLPAIEGRHFTIDPASVGVLGFDADHPLRRVVSLWNQPAA